MKNHTQLTAMHTHTHTHTHLFAFGRSLRAAFVCVWFHLLLMTPAVACSACYEDQFDDTSEAYCLLSFVKTLHAVRETNTPRLTQGQRQTLRATRARTVFTGR
jgi:hypothetical protein